MTMGLPNADYSAFFANLWRMKQFNLAYTSPDFLAQAVRDLKKTHGQFLQQSVAETGSSEGEIADTRPEAIFEQSVQESAASQGARKGREFLSQAVRELVALTPWGRHLFMLEKVIDPAAPDDQPSIGIILCAEKDEIEVEFALKTKANPIGVAEYQLQARLPAEFKGRLPTARQLADAVREALPPRK